MTQVNGQVNGGQAPVDAISDRAALQAQIASLKEQIAKAEKAAREATRKVKPLSIKVGDKGGIVVNLDSRFPHTFYANQLMKLLKATPELRAFMLAHFDDLSFKSTDAAAEVDTWLGRTVELDKPKS